MGFFLYTKKIIFLIENFIKSKIKNSFASTVSEFTRGGSTGAGGKGHVKSASVSSPGPSAENGAPTDPLRQRYITDFKNKNIFLVSFIHFFFLITKMEFG